MIRYRAILSSCVAVAILACAAPASADPPLTLQPDAVYFVLGADSHMKLLFEGVTKANPGHPRGFKVSFPPHLYGPTDGFVIVKARPDAEMGIETVAMMFGKSIFGISYHACKETPVFHAAGGKIVYVTTIAYSGAPLPDASPPVITPPGWITFAAGFHFVQDLDGARAFLKARHPELADALEQGDFKLEPARSMQC